ncbi:unnamed protein product [Cuscuta epithymum]|uniref:Uncharacterized protein n=1 Tax=Cuscuta epithymum TaxID=186058 RepID=A0AAV0G4A6_9ASTE|nr:unnamed protein product [Cuscuta epithymum]
MSLSRTPVAGAASGRFPSSLPSTPFLSFSSLNSYMFAAVSFSISLCPHSTHCSGINDFIASPALPSWNREILISTERVLFHFLLFHFLDLYFYLVDIVHPLNLLGAQNTDNLLLNRM